MLFTVRDTGGHQSYFPLIVHWYWACGVRWHIFLLEPVADFTENTLILGCWWWCWLVNQICNTESALFITNSRRWAYWQKGNAERHILCQQCAYGRTGRKYQVFQRGLHWVFWTVLMACEAYLQAERCHFEHHFLCKIKPINIKWIVMDNIFSLLLAGRVAHCFLATDLGSQGRNFWQVYAASYNEKPVYLG